MKACIGGIDITTPLGWDIPARGYLGHECCPDPTQMFAALEYFRPEETSVIILGQDPYHSVNENGIRKANGLAFGINPKWEGPRLYSSFGNIAAEVTRAGYELTDYSLSQWANQRILLLNTRLTVEKGKPMSHANCGWEPVVDSILRQAARDDVIWLLFGAEARKAASKYPGIKLAVSHPCKYSATRGSSVAPAFVGSNIFGVANEVLEELGRPVIKWGNPLQ